MSVVARHRGNSLYHRRMTTFALVRGGWRGAWHWELPAPLLQQEGHDVVAMERHARPR